MSASSPNVRPLLSSILSGSSATLVQEGGSIKLGCINPPGIMTRSWFKGDVLDPCFPPPSNWLFTQLSCGEVIRHAAANADMSIDEDTFDMTLDNVHLSDDGYLTCEVTTDRGLSARNLANIEVYSE